MNTKTFEEAIQSAHNQGLTTVNPVKEGLSFYSTKNLDPVWDESKESPIVKIEKFEMTNQIGKSISEKYFSDKITIFAFFFASCPGFCPTLLKNLQSVEAKLAGFKNIQYVAMSVDPENDSPVKLKKYFEKMKFNSKTWTLLTGKREEIYKFARETLLSEVFESIKIKGEIAHSEQFYIFDKNRKLRGMVKGTRKDVSENVMKVVSLL
jgi:protein SCO1/2